MSSSSPLKGCRALDITDERGWLAGRILADLGVEVLKVEPPGGDPGRNLAPLYQGQPGQSLAWFAYNLGKKSVSLNLETPAGRGLLRRLAPGADFLLESFPPKYMEGLGLGYSQLRGLNPGLIYAAITPFGQEGPYRDYQAPDLVAMAMGGFMHLTGDPDRPPLRVGFPIAYLLASAQAALGALLALHYRGRTGRGQLVDASAQEGVAMMLLNAIPYWELSRVVLKRSGRFRTGLSSGVAQRQVWPCADGAVAFMVIGGGGAAQSNRALAAWMTREGMADDFLLSIDWQAFDMATATQEFHQRVEAAIGRFFLSHTKQELHQGAVERGIWLQPVNTPGDIARSPQLQARDFWVSLPHPELGASLPYPGPFARLSATPLSLGPRAPGVGEHNELVYGEMGFSSKEMAVLKAQGVI